MEKQSKIKDQYAADVEAMASKSRFGYFSILPSHTAGITDNSSSIRTYSSIQHIGILTEKFIQNQEIFTQEQPPLAILEKTIFHILPQHFMALHILTQARLNAKRHLNRQRNGNKKILTSQLVSIKHCKRSII